MSDYLFAKLKELVLLPSETEWVEFKLNKADPEDIGGYISALSNGAALAGQSSGWMAWGVQDGTHSLEGTSFDPAKTKVGAEELEAWLARLLAPRLDFRFYRVENEGRFFVLLEIPAARHQPTAFKSERFIRIGSNKKPLREYPEKERTLWDKFRDARFENDLALDDLDWSRVLELLSYPDYFLTLGKPLPENRVGILQALESERFIHSLEGGRYQITNLGAILFARDIDLFPRLKRKALRVIVYADRDRTKTVKEQVGRKGYSVGFEGAIEFINALLPMNEVIGKALRREVRMFPEIAIRELVANALIHQDFSIIGSGPMVEIFSDRIEITNPGAPLIETARLLDLPPKSRNEDLAAFMRRINICEERGSGIDKVISAVEEYQLPPPDFRTPEDNTRVILYGLREHSEMSPEERIRACYQHACLLYESGGQKMTNATLRERLGIKQENYSMASKVISLAKKKGLIKDADPGSGKNTAYVPFYA